MYDPYSNPFNAINKYNIAKFAHIIFIDPHDRYNSIYGFVIPKFYKFNMRDEYDDKDIRNYLKLIIPNTWEKASITSITGKIKWKPNKKRSTICIFAQPHDEIENTLLHELIHVVDISRCPNIAAYDNIEDPHNTNIWNEFKHILDKNCREQSYSNYINELIETRYKY